MKSGEPIPDSSLAKHTPGGNGRSESPERELSQITARKQAPNLPSRHIVNNNTIRICKFLKPSRKVWRFADRRLLARISESSGLAHHDRTGGDADARLQVFASDRHFECGHNCKGGAHRTFRVRLPAFGPAEIT